MGHGGRVLQVEGGKGCITFGLSCIKHLTGLMHWIQDCFCTNNDPDSVTFDGEALTEAQSCALICKSDIDLVNMNSKVADPITFKDEYKWPEWSKAFTNYLSVIHGINGIPLVYVICKEEDPEDGVEYLTFTEQMIAHALLTGQYYEADSHHAHTLLTSFLQGELTENWIHPIAYYKDGHHDMITLHNYYAGEGNSTCCIANAKHIQMTLHYKSKHALPFSKFLDSMQKMFTIFKKKGSLLLNEPRSMSFLPRFSILVLQLPSPSCITNSIPKALLLQLQ